MKETAFTCDRCGATSRRHPYGAASFSEVLVTDVVEGPAGKFESTWHLCAMCRTWLESTLSDTRRTLRAATGIVE